MVVREGANPESLHATGLAMRSMYRRLEWSSDWVKPQRLQVRAGQGATRVNTATPDTGQRPENGHSEQADILVAVA